MLQHGVVRNRLLPVVACLALASCSASAGAGDAALSTIDAPSIDASTTTSLAPTIVTTALPTTTLAPTTSTSSTTVPVTSAPPAATTATTLPRPPTTMPPPPPPPTEPPTTLAPQPVTESVVIGTSLGGRPIVAQHKPGSDAATHRILVVGQIHGEEPAGLAVVHALVAAHIPETVDLWLIATVNPDGGAIGRRGNNNGVDLNRNFPGDWEPPGGPNTSAEHYSGEAPGSEPETQAVMNFVAAIHPDVSIWYHQPWNTVDCEERVGPVCHDYGASVGLTVTHQPRPGTSTDREMNNGYGVGFVVEFGYGRVSAGVIARHVAAAMAA
jgi:protein MpaA